MVRAFVLAGFFALFALAPVSYAADDAASEGMQIASISPDAASHLSSRIDRDKLRGLVRKGRSILKDLSDAKKPVKRQRGGGGTVALPANVPEGLSAEESAAYQQKMEEWMGESTDPFDIILSVRRKGKTVSNAMVGLQKGPVVYVPLIELANLIRFHVESDFDALTFSGFAGNTENVYRLDVANNVYANAGGSAPFSENAVIVQEFGQGIGDVYVATQLINRLWDLRLNVVYEDLALSIDTPRLLPFERDKLREERQEDFLAKLRLEDEEELAAQNVAFVPNDYKLISKPAVSLTNESRWDKERSLLSNNTNVSGTSDFLKTHADYNVQTRFDNEDGYDVRNARLRMERRAHKGDELPLGLKLAQGGDVSDRPSSLIDKNVSGTGLFVSNKPFQRQQSFDVITVEGTGQPGWDVEIYNGGKLENFGVVNEFGEYRFDNVQLTYGKNKITTILYGPQGQVIEDEEIYDIANTLLPKGDLQVEAAMIDVNQRLVEVDDERKERPTDGIYRNVSVKTGFNEYLSPFVTNTSLNTRDGRKDYVTAGANFSALGGLGLIEGYKDMRGGSALDMRYSARFAGARLNMRSSFMNGFESDGVNFGDAAKTYEGEIRAFGNVPTPVGGVALGGNAVHTEYESGSDSTYITTSQAYGFPGLRFSNVTNSRLRENSHENSSGRLSLRRRLSDFWNVRGVLNYDIFPEKDLSGTRFEARYTDRANFTSSFDVNHDLQDQNTSFGVDASYDFGTFLGGVGLNWDTENNIDAVLRTSMSLGPYKEDGSYIASSENITKQTALKSRVFQDVDLDGVFSEGDIPIEGARLIIDNIKAGYTDEDGTLYSVNPAGRGVAEIEVEQSSLSNELLVPAYDTTYTVLRPVTRPFVDIPMIISGSVDGNAYFEDGRPSPTLRVQLIDQENEVVQETVTDFDGFYSFNYVRPGNYTVRAAPSHKLNVEPAAFTLAQNDPFVYNVDLEIAAPEKPALLKSLIKLKGLLEKGRDRLFYSAESSSSSSSNSIGSSSS